MGNLPALRLDGLVKTTILHRGVIAHRVAPGAAQRPVTVRVVDVRRQDMGVPRTGPGGELIRGNLAVVAGGALLIRHWQSIIILSDDGAFPGATIDVKGRPTHRLAQRVLAGDVGRERRVAIGSVIQRRCGITWPSQLPAIGVLDLSSQQHRQPDRHVVDARAEHVWQVGYHLDGGIILPAVGGHRHVKLADLGRLQGMRVDAHYLEPIHLWQPAQHFGLVGCKVRQGHRQRIGILAA